jgi:hypothetical protein
VGRFDQIEEFLWDPWVVDHGIRGAKHMGGQRREMAGITIASSY